MNDWLRQFSEPAACDSSQREYQLTDSKVEARVGKRPVEVSREFRIPLIEDRHRRSGSFRQASSGRDPFRIFLCQISESRRRQRAFEREPGGVSLVIFAALLCGCVFETFFNGLAPLAALLLV
jgi:hypothetical protein